MASWSARNDARDWHENFCQGRVRILIADDQKSVGTTLAALVCHCHHEVVAVVGSGLEAIHAYARHKPDVVLMDYWMAKLNGATAVPEHSRERPRGPHHPGFRFFSRGGTD